ncbi:transposase [Paraburkholderia sp. 5N]|uniref:Transposase n=1 Tax=Paraburkholderia elongata TaxID=2675747 RepID=A0A972SJC7_9BURK|nr:transposase [Paraburkholderia elongata]
MTRQRISDELWNTLEPFVPDGPCSPKGGRPRLDDQSASNGFCFVQQTGIPCAKGHCQVAGDGAVE